MDKRRTPNTKPLRNYRRLPPTTPPLFWEVAERNKAEEAPEGVKRANALRYMEYLGMVKMERKMTRKILKSPTPRMSEPSPSSGGASYKVWEVTVKDLLAATGELRERQGKLFRATAAIIWAVKEAEDGPWEAGPGLKEEVLRWLGEQVSWMDELEKSLDQKGWELAHKPQK